MSWEPASCALNGCDEPVRDAAIFGVTKYCSFEHAKEARKQQKREWRNRDRSGTGTPHGRRTAETRMEAESRQQPPYRTYQLLTPRALYRSIAIVQRQPAPLPFVDDLDATLEHGSPGNPAHQTKRFI